MGEVPGGTPDPKRWGSARRAVRAGGRRAGQPIDLPTARRTKKEGRRPKRLVFLSPDLREGAAGGARKDPDAAVPQPSSSRGEVAPWQGKRLKETLTQPLRRLTHRLHSTQRLVPRLA